MSNVEMLFQKSISQTDQVMDMNKKLMDDCRFLLETIEQLKLENEELKAKLAQKGC